MSELILPRPVFGRRRHGYGGSSYSRGAVASSGGGGAPTPDGFLEYLASLGVGAGQATWTSQGTNTARMLESGAITLTDPDANFNGEPSLGFDGSSHYRIDEAQLSRTNQRWLLDGTISYWGYAVFRVDSSGDARIFASQSGLDAGVQLMQRTSSGFMRYSIYNGTSQYFAQTANASAPAATEQVAFFRYDLATNKLGVRAQGGSWVEATLTTPSAGDASDAIRLMSDAADTHTTGALVEWHIRKELPADEASIEAALVAQYGL